MTDLSTLGVIICLPLVVVFGIIAILNARHIYEDDSIVFYLTARNTISAPLIALSFLGASVGASVFFWTAVMIGDPIEGAGLLGVLSLSLSNFGGVLMIAWLGCLIREKYPDVISLGQYAKNRFGYFTQIFVTAVSFGNLTMAMAQDYIAIGIIFSQMLHIQPVFPIIVVGLTTSIYSFIGGVYVSIMIHKYQLPFALLALLITIIYIGVTFDWAGLEPLPPHLKFTSQGAKSMFMFPIFTFSDIFFSDSLWQRAWAAKDNNALKKGGLFGGILNGLVVFFFAIFAFLASWSGQQGADRNSLFNIVGSDAPQWILIVISMLAITMNESNIDAIQNALVNNLMSLAMSFGVRLSLSLTRVVVLLINIPIILISIQELDIMSVLLFGNMMTSFTMAPILLSMVPMFDEYISQASLLFCYVFSMIGLLLYGYICTGYYFYGLYTFVYLNYNAGAFLVAFFGPVVGLLIWNSCEKFLMSTKFGRHKLVRNLSSDDQQAENLFSEMEYV